MVVPAGSPIVALDELDRAGLRLAAGRGDSIGLFLGRTLKAATLVLLFGLERITARAIGS